MKHKIYYYGLLLFCNNNKTNAKLKKENFFVIVIVGFCFRCTSPVFHAVSHFGVDDKCFAGISCARSHVAAHNRYKCSECFKRQFGPLWSLTQPSHAHMRCGTHTKNTRLPHTRRATLFDSILLIRSTFSGFDTSAHETPFSLSFGLQMEIYKLAHNLTGWGVIIIACGC